MIPSKICKSETVSRQPIQMGSQARADGIHVNMNPFMIGTNDHAHWCEGWGMQDYRRDEWIKKTQRQPIPGEVL